MSIALIPNSTSLEVYLNLCNLLIKKKKKVVVIITNKHVEKFLHKIPKNVKILKIIEPDKSNLNKISNIKINNFFYYFFIYLKNYLKSLIFFYILNIKKVFVTGDRENGTILSILKIAKKRKKKVFIFHSGGLSSKNMLLISRQKLKSFNVSNNEKFFNKYKKQCYLAPDKKIYSFYNPFLTKIFYFFNILPNDPWISGKGNSDVVLVETNYIKSLYSKYNVKKKIEVVGSEKIDNINNNFKNFEATNNKLENLTHKRNSIKIGFVPSLWLEHNLFSKEESYRRNNELCKILKNSINLKKIDVFVFLHPKQKLRDYLWIEKKYNFKLMKQNISHLICNLDLLYTGFSLVYLGFALIDVLM